MKKVLFLHKPKCAGSYLDKKFEELTTRSEFVHNPIVYFNGWRYRFQDWHFCELDSLAKIQIGPRLMVHQHLPGVPEKEFYTFKEHGWWSFTTLRDPRDAVLSWYFYHRQHSINAKLAGIDANFYGNVSLEEYMIEQALDRHSWELPVYHKEIDWIGLAEEPYFRVLFDKIDQPYFQSDPENVSENRGYAYYRKVGLISDDADNIFCSTDEYQLQKDLIQKIRTDNGF